MAEGQNAVQLETQIAEVCGLLNAATGRLVDLIAQVLERGTWEGDGLRSAEHWVAWKCGVSPGRARTLVAMARRLGELPETKTALEAGELSEDQAAVVCRRAPAHVDAQVVDLARAATVIQLRRVLSRYSFEVPLRADDSRDEQARRVSFGYDDEGWWRLSAVLPADEGALWERALAEAREARFRAGDHDPGPGAKAASVSWPDALVAVADQSLSAGAALRPHRERHRVLLHVETDGNGRLHLGPAVSAGMRRFLTCDSRIRPVLESGAKAVSVGRQFRTVPERTRVVVEDRDGGCRVPGCDRSRWLHIHHLEHWEDGGTTDTPNLLALCSRHHRLHHLGRLGMSGNADDPDGVTFTDEHGRCLAPSGRPAPPGQRLLPVTAAALAIPSGNWSHPTGERLDPYWVEFNEHAVSRVTAPIAAGARSEVPYSCWIHDRGSSS